MVNKTLIQTLPEATDTRPADRGTEYDAFRSHINTGFQSRVGKKNASNPVFTTDTAGLWNTYLSALPEPLRQHHTCQTCRKFIERFGGLVTIDTRGVTTSALWCEDKAPALYKPAVTAMVQQVQRAQVTGVFLSSKPVLGTPTTGEWHHLAVRLPVSMVHVHRIQTAGQKMAEKREDFKTVTRALDDFTPAMVQQALKLLRTEKLYRNEKVLGQAQWLSALHESRQAVSGARAVAHVTWRAVATAAAGLCHPRNSMIGSLLEDIAAGLAFEEVARRFADKMHPLRYQRPQTAPKAGAIEAAEKIVAQMGIAQSFPRRFARLDEVETIWQPVAPKTKRASGQGFFSQLRPKPVATPDMKTPLVTMTWEKFARTVLPTAEQIEFHARKDIDSYTALVTAVHAEAPPILQWDREDRRNPVSWYFWHGGSTAEQFGLRTGAFHRVSAVTLKPSMWGRGGFEHQGLGVLFIIEGAKDTRTPSGCLFPEILKSELHGVRSVIEAHSNQAHVTGAEQASAAGVMLQKGSNWNAQVRVTTGGLTVDYQLDRWD